MLEGGGETPILSPFQLEKLGFKIVAYLLSLFGVSIHACNVGLSFTHESFSNIFKISYNYDGNSMSTWVDCIRSMASLCFLKNP